MPLSTELAHAVVAQLDAAAHGRFDGPEMLAARPLLELQARWSALPTTATLVAETLHSREGWHLFLYPFAGRHAHLGLASLLAWRAAERTPATFSMAFNDYGLELLSATPIDWPTLLASGELFATHTLLHDVLASLNAGELAQRRFREIARVSGLVFQGYPGAHKSTRQLQASSGLFYEVFRRHDPGNLLLTQAENEVLRQELDLDRIDAALTRMRALRLELRALQRPSPFGFPLMVERFREQLSTEKLADRIARMLADAERAAGPEPTDPDAAPRPAIDADVQAALRMTESPETAGKGSRRARRPRKTSKPLPLL
jgi:ATP-dependent Lhr-like helicase